MSNSLRGRYVRQLPFELVGETALLRYDVAGGWLAQFDNLEKFGRNKHDWAFGWHRFAPEAFQLLEET